MVQLWFLLVFYFLAGTGASHTLHLGRTCPTIAPFPNLNLEKIMGLWFVAYQFDTSNTCITWNFTMASSSLDKLELTESRQLSVLDAIGVDHTHDVTAEISIANPEVPSNMRIRWPTSLTGKADFVIFDTDYTTYLAVFQCDRAGLLHRRSVTILSRGPEVDEMFVKRVRRLLDAAEIPHNELDKIEHQSCKGRGNYHWHIDSELFGLLPKKSADLKESVGHGVQDYDISELEIIGDGISPMAGDTFKGSIKSQNKEPNP